MVDWPLKFDIAEVTRAVDLGSRARLAQSVLVHGAHSVVIDAVLDGVAILSVSLLLANGVRRGVCRDGEPRHIFL